MNRSCCLSGGCMDFGSETFHVDGSREVNICMDPSPWGGSPCAKRRGHEDDHGSGDAVKWPRERARD